METILAGVRTHDHEGVAGPGGRGAHERADGGNPDTHRVHQRVPAVARPKDHLTTHVGDAQAVAIAANARDDAGKEVPVVWVVEGAEAQRVEQSDGASAHGKDVAHNAADTGRGALVRLDRAGVVVRLDLHHDDPAVADVHSAGVLAAERGQDLGAVSREVAEERSGVLIAAMLAPERADHPQLNGGRLAAEALPGQLVLRAAERDLGEDFVRDGG